MAGFKTTLHSPLPAEAAFDFLADLANMAHWDPGVLQAAPVEDRPPRLGAAYDVTVKGFPRPLTLRYHLTEYAPHHMFVAEARSPRLTSVDRIIIEPDHEGGSIVTYDAQLTINGLLRMADPLVGVIFDRIGRRAEQGLIENLKARPTPLGPSR